MIISYETEFWKSFGNQFTEFKELNYANTDKIFKLYQQVKSLPVMYFNRGEEPFTNTRPITIYHTTKRYKAIPIALNYVAHLFVEKQVDAEQFSKRAFSYFSDFPYINLRGDEDECDIPIAQRLLYIKIVEIRNSEDSSGALRDVTFSWKVSLLLSTDREYDYTTIKKINVIINNTETSINYEYE